MFAARCGRRVDHAVLALDIHIAWKVLGYERMEPPIQTESLRSGGALPSICLICGASAIVSYVIRSAMPPKVIQARRCGPAKPFEWMMGPSSSYSAFVFWRRHVAGRARP